MADMDRKLSGKPALKWGIAAFVLAAGYADLVRGGDTIAPILLVIGYAVLVPLAILAKRNAGE